MNMHKLGWFTSSAQMRINSNKSLKLKWRSPSLTEAWLSSTIRRLCWLTSDTPSSPVMTQVRHQPHTKNRKFYICLGTVQIVLILICVSTMLLITCMLVGVKLSPLHRYWYKGWGFSELSPGVVCLIGPRLSVSPNQGRCFKMCTKLITSSPPPQMSQKLWWGPKLWEKHLDRCIDLLTLQL